MKSTSATKVVILFPFRSGADAICACAIRDITVAIAAATSHRGPPSARPTRPDETEFAVSTPASTSGREHMRSSIATM